MGLALEDGRAARDEVQGDTGVDEHGSAPCVGGDEVAEEDRKEDDAHSVTGSDDGCKKIAGQLYVSEQNRIVVLRASIEFFEYNELTGGEISALAEIAAKNIIIGLARRKENHADVSFRSSCFITVVERRRKERKPSRCRDL